MSDKLDAGPYWGNDAIDPSFAATQRLAREYDELRAENERLTKLNLNLFDERDWLEGYADNLRVENERLKEVVVELKAAHAAVSTENERLRRALIAKEMDLDPKPRPIWQT